MRLGEVCWWDDSEGNPVRVLHEVDPDGPFWIATPEDDTEGILFQDPDLLSQWLLQGILEECGQAYDDGPFGVIRCTLPEGHRGRCQDPSWEEDR